MKTSTTALLLLACALPATAALVASYDAGVAPTAGTTGAADPTTQGWTFTGVTNNNYAYGGDSTIGGWRVVDGTTTALANYSQAIGAGDLADMNTLGWVASCTVAISQDAVSKAGGGVENYYANDTRRNNALWVESASGATDYAYVLSFASNATGKILFSFPASTGRYYQLLYKTNLSTPLLTNDLGWGVPGMVVTNDSLGEWYGDVRVRLTAP